MRAIASILAGAASAGVIGAVVLLEADRGAAAQDGPCSVAGSRTMLENADARVYVREIRDTTRSFQTFGCAKATGHTALFDDPLENDYAFLPPAINLTEAMVGSANQQCPYNDPDPCESTVQALNLVDESTSAIVNWQSAGPEGRLMKVGSLRVNNRGSLAWIACPERNENLVIGSKRPNCVRPGDRNYVFKAERDQLATRLDLGRGIDPSSLTRRGERIYWVKYGKRRGAILR